MKNETLAFFAKAGVLSGVQIKSEESESQRVSDERPAALFARFADLFWHGVAFTPSVQPNITGNAY